MVKHIKRYAKKDISMAGKNVSRKRKILIYK